MALIKCSECGHEVSDKASVCPNCGCPIEKGLVCNDCGYSLSPTDKTCPNCGCPVKGSKIGAKWKKPLFAAVALVAVLGMAYGIWAVQNGGLKDIQITQGLTDAVHRYDEVSNFHEGLSAVCKSQKWGYINAKGEEVIPCKYVGACDFSEGLACVYLEGDDMPIAFIDKKGHIILEGFFGDTALGEGSFWPISFKDGKCFVYDKDRHDIWINKKGQIVDEPQQSESVVVEPSDYEVFYEDGKYGIKDSLGNVIVTAKYSYINEYSQGLAVAYLDCDDKTIYGYIDKKGNNTFTDKDFAELEQCEKRVAEEKRQEEERKRREGVEKIVSITIELDKNHGRVIDMSGNYGAKMYSGMRKFNDYAIITNLIRVPNGKVWIFKRINVSESGLWGIGLFYYSKESGRSGVDIFDELYKLPGNPPILRAGDGFRIAAESTINGIATVEVFFSEKNEEYYY